MIKVWKSTTVTILSNVKHEINLLYKKNKGTAVTYSVWSNRIIFKNRINHDVKDKELANFWFCRTCKLKQHLHTSWPTYKAWLICSFDWKSTSVQRHLAGSQKFKVLWHGRAHPTDTNQTPLVSTLIIKPPGTPWFFLSSSHQGLTRLTAGMRYSLPAEWDFLVGPVHIWSGITDEKEG